MESCQEQAPCFFISFGECNAEGIREVCLNADYTSEFCDKSAAPEENDGISHGCIRDFIESGMYTVQSC